MMLSFESSWHSTRRRTRPTESNDVSRLGNQDQSNVNSAPVIIDLDTVDTFDDDIAISSPTAFAEARRHQARRHRQQTDVIDLDSDGPESIIAQTTCKKRKSQEHVNADHYLNIENHNTKSVKEKAIPIAQPRFCCPICIGPLVEEMSTKCGHIFCKKCIETALISQKKCPTCRKKTSMKNVIRVYLPAITY